MAGLNLDPNLMLQMSAGLLSGRTAPEQMGNMFGNVAQYNTTRTQKAEETAQRNRTLEIIGQSNPELAQAVQAGIISPSDAFNAYSKQRQMAQQPQKVDFKTLPDGQYGYFDPSKREFVPLGKAQKPNSGFEVTLPDGTSVRNGSFGTQDQKNVANRVTEAQEMSAAGASLKQTAQMLRGANENVGYSGVGGEAIGTGLDLAEQLGVPIAGKAAARAQMRSGGLDVALAQVQKTKGAISNAEMSLFMAASPGMKNTPQGNAALIDMIDKIGDRQIMRAQEMEKWRQQYGTLDGFEAEWGKFVDSNPIITEQSLGGAGPASGGEDPLGIR